MGDVIRGEKGKLALSFLFLILITLILSIRVSADEVKITYKYVDVESENELNSIEETVDVGEESTYNPPETISVDGKDYTLVELGDIKTDVSESTEVEIGYTKNSISAKPEGIVPAEDASEGMVNVDNILWRINGDKIETKIDFNVSGKHMATRLGTVSQTVGTDKELIEDKSDYMKDDTSMKKSSNFDEEFSDTNSFERGTDGVYKVKIMYWYTNLATGNYVCDLGTEERCFNWVLDEEEPYNPYWGSFSETVEVDGEEVRSTNIYELEIEIGIDDVSNQNYIISELPEELPIGKGLYNRKNVISGKVTPESELIEKYYERFDLDPKLEYDVYTQQSIDVTEYIGYENDFGEELKVNGSAKYYIDSIDDNIKEVLDTEDGRAVVELVYDSNKKSFVLDKIFGLTNKYGVQFLSDRKDFVNVTEDLKELNKDKNEELKRLELGDDDVVNLDYLKSRYFLGVNSEEGQYKDTVVLEGVGLNNLTLKYDKIINVSKPLLVEDSVFKGYEVGTENVEYTDSEVIKEDTLKGYLESYNTGKVYNSVRKTGDSNLEKHINRVEDD